MNRRTFIRSSAQAGLAAGVGSVLGAEAPAAAVDVSKIGPPPAGAWYFCTDPAHEHDDLAAELLTMYRCRSWDELGEKLAAAIDWTHEQNVEWCDVTDGPLHGQEYNGPAFDLGFYKVASRGVANDENEGCSCYQHLLGGALALLVFSHPALRGLVERMARGDERKRDLFYWLEVEGHDFNSFDEYNAWYKAQNNQ
jgi:hypothetical protein